MARGEQWTEITGAPAKHLPNRYLSSGHFPAYDEDVVLTITNVDLGKNVDMENGERETGLFAHFKETPRLLLLRKHHQLALTRIFGKTVESWRGPVALYCAEKAVKAGGEIYDQVRIRPAKGKRTPPPAETPNPGGGPGHLGTPPAPTADLGDPSQLTPEEQADLELESKS